MDALPSTTTEERVLEIIFCRNVRFGAFTKLVQSTSGYQLTPPPAHNSRCSWSIAQLTFYLVQRRGRKFKDVPVLAFPLYRYKLPLCHQSADVRVTYEFSYPSIRGAELKTQARKNEITAQAWLTHQFWFTYNRTPRAVLSPLHNAAFSLNALV